MNKSLTRAEAQPFVERILATTDDRFTATFAGQIRRESPLVSELNVVVLAESFPAISYSVVYVELADIFWHRPHRNVAVGTAEISVRGEQLPLSITVCDRDSFGGSMLFATGPAEFAQALKTKALKQRLHLSAMGLFDNEQQQVDDGTEMNIFHKLGTPWLEPASREAFAKPSEDEAVFEREVRSSRGDSTYLVRISGNKASCECKGFLHNRSCRHLTTVRAELGLPTPLKTEVLP